MQPGSQIADLHQHIPDFAQQVTCARCGRLCSGGLAADWCLAEAFNYARWCRLADGPDQVHMMPLGKQLVRRYAEEDE